MHGQYNKLDVTKALKLRAQDLSNTIIAKRLNVTTGAVYAAFRKYDAQHGIQETCDCSGGRHAGHKPLYCTLSVT